MVKSCGLLEGTGEVEYGLMKDRRDDEQQIDRIADISSHSEKYA